MLTPNPDRPSDDQPDAGTDRPVLVLFDWNGTVMNDVARAVDAANQALERFGMVLSEEEFQSGFTLPLLDWFSDLGVPEEYTAEAAAQWNRSMEVEAAAREFAPETITALRDQGVITGVVTAAAPGSVREDLRANGLDGLFDLVYTDVENKVECLRSLRHLGEPALYVGDTAYDINSARAAGYTTVSIGGGYQHATILAGARPDHHVEDLAAVLDLCRPDDRRPGDSRRPGRPLSLEQAVGIRR